MQRVTSFWITLGYATFVSAAFALPLATGGPILSETPKSYVALKQWDDLIHMALDGNARSATELGTMYKYGIGISEDVPEAMRWLSRAVDLGSIEARRELGFLLLKGKGIEKNPELAASFIPQAADACDLEAEAALSMMYADEDGISQD